MTAQRSIDLQKLSDRVRLFGEYDRNLSAIEATLGVAVHADGDRLLLAGDDAAVTRAENVVRRVLDAAVGGAHITPDDVALALSLKRREASRVILSRPAVEAGERLGFLPGDLREKVDPYMRPLFDALGELLDDSLVGKYMERGTLEVAPLAYMRGRTLSDAFVILDEAQNATDDQLKQILSLIAEAKKPVIYAGGGLVSGTRSRSSSPSVRSTASTTR